MNNILRATGWLIVVNCIVSGLGVRMAAAERKYPTIELSEVDLFSSKNWSSSQISVWGLRLGMSRADANEEISRHNLRLRQSGLQYEPLPCADSRVCETVNSKGDYVGPTITFDPHHSILEIIIEPVPPYAFHPLKTSSLTLHLKGKMFDFFNKPYSDEERIALFGHETKVENVKGQLDDKVKDSEYIYQHFGATVTVSPRNSVDRTLELVRVAFYPPIPRTR
jgi:hypothetical protein